MFPLSGDGEKFGRENMNAVDLARRDFVQATANLRFASGPPIRPLAVVACDDADGGRRAARHLAGSIRVPAVIGFASSMETIELATSTFVPGNVLTLASVSMSPLLGAIPHAISQPRIVFRTTYNTLDTGPALAAFVSHLEAERWPRQKLRGNELRISVARMKNRSAVAMSEALFGALRFNGKSALDNGGAYQELGYERTEEFAKLAEDIARHRPHVVIASDPPLIERIEAVWPRDRPRPTYLMFTPFNDQVLEFLGRDRDRRRRMFGMTTISTTTSNARFVVHYNETFPEPITRTLAPNSHVGLRWNSSSRAIRRRLGHARALGTLGGLFTAAPSREQSVQASCTVRSLVAMWGDSEVEGGDSPTPSDPGVLRASTLLVVAPSGMTTVSLPSQGRVFLGRAAECEVQIDDPKLSRRHARIDVGERVTYTDLGSLNGSFSREERLEPNVPLVVGSGDAVTLGGTVIVLQKASRRPRAAARSGRPARRRRARARSPRASSRARGLAVVHRARGLAAARDSARGG